jgi:hypothetical protein
MFPGRVSQRVGMGNSVNVYSLGIVLKLESIRRILAPANSLRMSPSVRCWRNQPPSHSISGRLGWPVRWFLAMSDAGKSHPVGPGLPVNGPVTRSRGANWGQLARSHGRNRAQEVLEVLRRTDDGQRRRRAL